MNKRQNKKALKQWHKTPGSCRRHIDETLSLMVDLWMRGHEKLDELEENIKFETEVSKELAKGGPFFLCKDCKWKRLSKDNYLDCVNEYNKEFCRLRLARIEVDSKWDNK